jgi:hypothetical protein
MDIDLGLAKEWQGFEQVDLHAGSGDIPLTTGLISSKQGGTLSEGTERIF